MRDIFPIRNICGLYGIMMNYSNHGYIEALYTPSILMWRYKRHVYSVYFKDPRTPGLLVTPVSIWHDPFTSTFEVRLAYIWDMHLRLEWYASNIVYLCIYKCDYIYIYIYIYYNIYVTIASHPQNGSMTIRPMAPPTSVGRLADQLRTLRRRLRQGHGKACCRDMAIVGLFNIYST